MLDVTTTPELTPDYQAPRGKFFLYALLLMIVLGAVWFVRQPHVQATIAEWEQHSLWENVRRLVTSDDRTLKGELENRINILLLGQGGLGHDGPYLTDSMVVASFKPSTKELALITVPRDLLVPIPGFGSRKINNANALGEQAHAGKGAELASEVMNTALGIPIHYYARLDFVGFARIIDELGGLPINISEGFSDTQYPDAANGFMTVSFSTGWQVLSGTRALQYARSRHAAGNQGSDFARSRRQLQIMQAFKDKLLSPGTLLNPARSLRLYSLISESIQTNISAGEAVRLVDLLRAVKGSHIITRNFDSGPGGLLREIIGTDGAFLLVPIAADFRELQAATQNIFDQGALVAEQPTIQIENGTNTPGLAETISQELTRQGFTVRGFGNANQLGYTTTMVYDYVNGAKPASRKWLEKRFGVTAITLERSNSNETDFRIILGANQVLPKN